MATVTMTGKEYEELLRKMNKMERELDMWKSVAISAYMPSVPENNRFTYAGSPNNNFLAPTAKPEIIAELNYFVSTILNDQQIATLVRGGLYYYGVDDRSLESYKGAGCVDIRENEVVADRLAKVQRMLEAEEEVKEEEIYGDSLDDEDEEV